MEVQQELTVAFGAQYRRLNHACYLEPDRRRKRRHFLDDLPVFRWVFDYTALADLTLTDLELRLYQRDYVSLRFQKGCYGGQDLG